MTANIKTLNIKTELSASRRDSESSTGSSYLAHLDSAAHMKRQLADLREKEMRIARCWYTVGNGFWQMCALAWVCRMYWAPAGGV